MDPTHDPLERLILGYEDLDDGDRARADAHLAGCAACRDLLAALQRVEREAKPQGSLPPLEDPGLVDPALRREADASLERLLAGVGASAPRSGAAAVPGRTPPVPSLEAEVAAPAGPARVLRMPWRRRWAMTLVPAAAAVIAVVLWPRPAHEPALMPGARAVHGTQYRGDGAAGFRTGDDFALEFELARLAHVAVVHLDPAGEVALLYPGTGTAPQILPAGRHRLPADTAAVAWRLEPPGGRETFLIAAAERGLPSSEALTAALAGIAAGPRDARVVAARELLERRAGAVQTIEIEHGP